MVTRSGFYPLCDEAFRHTRNTRAKWTGEKRRVKAGEWYLSGAIVGAYKAHADIDTPHLIAKLVQVETITIEREVEA